MAKYKNLDEYIKTFSKDGTKYYDELIKIIKKVPYDVKQKLFAGQVAFYVEEHLERTFHSSPVVIVAFFKDHINIFAEANKKYQSRLPNYTFTEKGTMQVYFDQTLDTDLLVKLFYDSLSKRSV